MIVAVRDLRLTARIDDVELRGDLIAGPEPGLADERDDNIAVIGGERHGVGEAELLQRVPHAVVRAGFGEMVAAGRIVSFLLVDHRPEMGVDGLDRPKVAEGLAEDDDAGPAGHRLDPFGHHLLARIGRGGGAAHRVAVINEDVGDDVAGERIVGRIDRALDQRPKRVEVAPLLGEKDAIGSQPPCVVVLHEPPPARISFATIQ